MRKKHILWLVVTALFVAAILWRPIVSNVEQARYTVVKAEGNIEIRDYDPMIVAETEISGERKEAINQGFRIIADYIFGNNMGNNTVAMTAPVMQEAGQKLAMNAPVTQQGDGNNWIVRFVMPSQYSLDSLPKPNNVAVKLTKVLGKRFAVIRFSGVASADSLKLREAELKSYFDRNHLMAIGQTTYAFFDPPWTLPFLRRNEIMMEISKINDN